MATIVAGTLQALTPVVSANKGISYGTNLSFRTPPVTVTVCDEPSLGAALAVGGRVLVGCDGVITLTQTPVVTNTVILDASGHILTLSGGGTTRILEAAPGADVTLLGLTLADGRSTNGGAIYNAGGRMVLSGVALVNNLATNGFLPPGPSLGGAVFNHQGTVLATNCEFRGNTAGSIAASFSISDAVARGGAISPLRRPDDRVHPAGRRGGCAT